MKQKLFYTFILVFMIGLGTKALACSPERIPFDVYANNFTPDGAYYAVEGYYIDSSTFMVTYASDSIIKVGKALPVYEYGPFGDNCEIESKIANISIGETGKDKLRVLILFKNETSEAKLVTPIFQSEGISLKEEMAEMIDPQSEFADGSVQAVKRSVPKESLYQRLFNGNKVALVWNEEIFKPFN